MTFTNGEFNGSRNSRQFTSLWEENLLGVVILVVVPLSRIIFTKMGLQMK